MGSFSVLNNLPSVNGINQLNLNNVNLNRTLNRLASGKRINSGADDAAGLQIADQLRGNVMALNQAQRNASDGISVLQIADAALGAVTSLLWRAVTLAEEANSDLIDTKGKQALQNEWASIQNEINRIGQDTNFNGQYLFTNSFTSVSAGSQVDVFVGDLTASSYISVNLTRLNSSVIGAMGSINIDGVNTVSVLSNIKNALGNVAIMRGDLGVGMNRLQAAIDVLAVTSQNTLSAEDAIRSANMAEEISNMTKFQILAQTGIAALAQANANSQNVLGLLR